MKSLRAINKSNKQESMNCYIGLAKRIAKSCFPPVILVPQLEPLDAKNIIKHEVKNVSTNKGCFALSDAHERVFKPISDDEAWEATLAWAEAKAQERETKKESQTDTDESYESDDSEVGVSIHHMSLFGDDSDDYDSDDDDYIIDMIRRFEEEKRISKEKEKSLLKRMLESQSLSSDDTDDE